MKTLALLLLVLSTTLYAHSNYPAHWWEVIPESERQGSWEILPHECKKGELVLSKRNELGVFSNFAATPFEMDGVRYASIEGLWQMMKYPDPTDSKDIRNSFSNEYPYERHQVMDMVAFEAKEAGDLANKVNKKHGIKWVSYQHKKFNYKDYAEGSKYHLKLMKKAIALKLKFNPAVYQLLMKTKGLKLVPDHKQGKNPPPSYLYHQILMDIRDKN
jgi:predicted NAD-dependent protein-ADP-ribosyltransferase YbiA (DUF1768 family)